MLDILDFTGSEHQAPINFSCSAASPANTVISSCFCKTYGHKPCISK